MNVKLTDPSQAEERLAAGRAVSTNIRAELNQQADNLEAEIHQLEERIRLEKEEAGKVEEMIENSVSGETRRGGEDKMLEDLEQWVLNIYQSCIGENLARHSTAHHRTEIRDYLKDHDKDLVVINIHI